VKALNITNKIRETFGVTTAYFTISVFFLFGLITSRGDAAQGDWAIPLTVNVALNNGHSIFFVWSYNGFGNVIGGNYSFPFFPILNAIFAPLGFVGGAEVKVLSILLVALAGITMYFLARSFGLGLLSSFLSGLFFMTTAVVFNWLMFGWIYYILAYDLMPLMIIVTKKFIETNDFRYALLNGIILAAATTQPTFLLVFPLLGILFVIFESKGDLKTILRGFKYTVVSLLIWFLTILSFLTSGNSSTALSFYQGDFFSTLVAQFSHFSSLINPIRLWGSTFNYQFETYFPKELILLSFLPLLVAMVGLLLKPRDRRVLFCSLSYLFVFVSYQVYINLHYIVFNLPYGTIFLAPSIFLVPASLGIALLIGFTHQAISNTSIFNKRVSKRMVRNASSVLILILIISSSIPWWTGQTSGTPIDGPPTKLNLYQMPSDYKNWNNLVVADNDYFVLYVPMSSSAQIINSSYFSLPYEGVNGIFTNINNLPYVKESDANLFLNELFTENSQVAEHWGSYSIKYVVVYTNIQSSYNMDNILNRLSSQNGLKEVVRLPNVIVYENLYAKPVVYAEDSGTTTKITYHDPTTYEVLANSTSPYLLVLNQAFSNNWVASVNGTILPSSVHFQNDDGFNGWYINYTGAMNIKIYYAPQTIYLASTLVSVSTIIVIVLYLIVVTVRDVRRSRKILEIEKNKQNGDMLN
jgi:hypothetical protein